MSCLHFDGQIGAMREIIAQQNDDWEEWDLEELMDDMTKYAVRNSFQNECDCNYQDESNHQRHQRYRKKNC